MKLPTNMVHYKELDIGNIWTVLSDISFEKIIETSYVFSETQHVDT
jgi:hypothetical protein